ncbi:flavodoxin domain-containing protein [Kribbella sp. NPDC051952]|uniref:flavodoxin domain-containing protein n=1 Tax=Kribbella sp. NPDC051952 TaxID=3154851 RepID=UPI00342688A9
MSRKVLVAYASKMGATAGIAEVISDELRERGHEVDVLDVTQVRTVEPYDAVVLGSAIYLRRWRPEARQFLKRCADELRTRQVWLFHSGPVGPDKDQDQEMPPAVRRLAREIGATPAVTFAGRLEPATAKGFLARHLATGNMSGDSRDWTKIRAWAADISAAISTTQRTWDTTPS